MLVEVSVHAVVTLWAEPEAGRLWLNSCLWRKAHLSLALKISQRISSRPGTFGIECCFFPIENHALPLSSTNGRTQYQERNCVCSEVPVSRMKHPTPNHSLPGKPAPAL